MYYLDEECQRGTTVRCRTPVRSESPNGQRQPPGAINLANEASSPSVGRTWMLGGSEPFTSCSATVCSESGVHRCDEFIGRYASLLENARQSTRLQCDGLAQHNRMILDAEPNGYRVA